MGKGENLPVDRKEHLTRLRNTKMARSAHSYVRGNTKRFYEWLASLSKGSLPEGPPVWICGDCHVGNLGPIANVQADVQVQVRDLDQTVIGNPVHDLIRLGLSLAMAARGADLPGVTTTFIIENLIDGYTSAIQSEMDGAASLATEDQPEAMRTAVLAATGRSWKELARERMKSNLARLPLGKLFWKLNAEEEDQISRLFEKGAVTRLATLLNSRPDDVPVTLVDAAYWVKGCSSLGLLRYAVLLGVGQPASKEYEHCLIDIKEALPAAAPAYANSKMPSHHGRRVVEGARHLSPHLGERMLATELLGKPVFLRELMPQDLKVEIDRLNAVDATKVARYLAGVVGKAHARQMDQQISKHWIADLKKNRSKTLDAPSWLWTSIVELIGSHEVAYLEHCRRHSLSLANTKPPLQE